MQWSFTVLVFIYLPLPNITIFELGNPLEEVIDYKNPSFIYIVYIDIISPKLCELDKEQIPLVEHSNVTWWCAGFQICVTQVTSILLWPLRENLSLSLIAHSKNAPLNVIMG